MAPVDSGPILGDEHNKTWTTHPLGWRKALFLAVKSRLIYLSGWEGNFWVQPTMPVEQLAGVLVCDADKDALLPDYWRRLRR